MVGDIPVKDVTTDDPTQNEYYRQFAENGAEWRAEFEKTLKRKVDIRLISLLVRQDSRRLHLSLNIKASLHLQAAR